MLSLEELNPDRHHVGPNFETCLSLFTCQKEMSRKTNISDSSIGHILSGRPIHRNRTRERYESMCGMYLDSLSNSPTSHIQTTQQASDLDPQPVFLVSVPASKANKLRKVLAMFDIEMVEID